jgi:hypothetical protein
LSPEFGDRVDLQHLTREMMSQTETELPRKLGWCAVAHLNTEHPHMHVALRGREDGRALRLDRAYIKFGIRLAAEDLCTAQLRYRMELDAVEAERREVGEQRFASLDRIIGRACENATGSAIPAAGAHFVFALTVPDRKASDFLHVRQRHLAARLVHLQKMGLAEPTGPNAWRVRNGFAAVLRAMQKAQDRRLPLQVHGAILFDDRLPLVVTNLRRTLALDGRVLMVDDGRSQEEYVRRVLEARRKTPGTMGTVRRADRVLAAQLYQRGASVNVIENAFVLAATRRLVRPASAPALGTIRSLAYFLHVIEEVLERRVSPEYFHYLRHRLERAAAIR